MKLQGYEIDALEYAIECLCWMGQDHAEQQDYDGQNDDTIEALKQIVAGSEACPEGAAQDCLEMLDDLSADLLTIFDAIDGQDIRLSRGRSFDALHMRRQIEYMQAELRRLQEVMA